MQLKTWIAAAVLAAGVVGAAGAATAAPIGAGVAFKDAAADASSVDKVVWRCWWAYGRRHCGHYYPPAVGLYYGGPRFYGYRGYGYRRGR